MSTSVKSMVEERLLLLTSAAEAQQKTLEMALRSANQQAINSKTEESHRTQLMERHALQLEGLIDAVERLLAATLRSWIGASIGLLIGIALGLLIGLNTH